MNPELTPSAELSPGLNRMPSNPNHIHLMGICGVGMASLAGLLKQKGYRVTGSDQNIYPPMSQYLQDLSIPVIQGYGPENLSPRPDLVIVGNVITRHNPEAVELSRLLVPYLSMPQALKAFAMGGKKTVVVCGTHGKTTTSAIASWLLEKAGLDPGFMVGGILNNFQGNFKAGGGGYFVIEGDEYDTAFFDKGPKFLHYSPWTVILTSIEFDHADIYCDLQQVVESFRRLIKMIPPEGLLIANGDDPLVMTEAEKAHCSVITYGFLKPVAWKVEEMVVEGKYTRVTIHQRQGRSLTLRTPLYGRHNIGNLLSTVILGEHLKIDQSLLTGSMETFQGVKRRQEIIGEKKGILVLDDFAHHPTAVRETVAAVKEKYGNRRLIATFEPRSNTSRRSTFQRDYISAFDRADRILIPEPPMMEKIPKGERFSSSKLVKDLRERGLEAVYCPDTDLLLEELLKQSRKGDVILIMSNGAFDNLHQRLLEAL